MTENKGRTTGFETGNEMFSKVPQVTVFFWIIKVLCTTVGETASDFLNVNLGFGLTATSIVAGIILAVVLFFQFRAKKYIPPIYWLAVVLISVFGTLITDILTDVLKFPLEAGTIIFTVALAATFALWYRSEKTLSIHSIFTTKREIFYWLAILFTFALGTATGDLMAEKLGLGYLLTGIIVLGIIAAAWLGYRLGLDAVLAFWIAYILTRPLGASLGDYLSQSKINGGLGLGASVTSAIFLLAILAVVIYLAATRRDFIAEPEAENDARKSSSGVIWQVAAVALLFVIGGTAGYFARQSQLKNQAAAAVTPNAPLGDLSSFKAIADDMLQKVNAKDMSGAKSGADDLEAAWDNAQARLKPMNEEKWTEMDNAIDDVLTKVRGGQTTSGESLKSFISVIDNLGKQSPKPSKAEKPIVADSAKPLGDLSAFRKIAEDMLQKVNAKDMNAAKSKAAELETAWDNAQAKLRPLNAEKWTLVDNAIDDVLKKARAAQPDATANAASINSLIAVINSLDNQK